MSKSSGGGPGPASRRLLDSTELRRPIRSDEVNVMEQDPRDKIYEEHKLAKWLLEYLCTFNNLDLFSIKRPATRQRLPTWSHLIRLFYVYVSIKTCINLVLQHEYDNCRDSLSRYMSRNNYNILATTGMDLIDELRSARNRLKSMGAPYMHVYFILECAYIYLLTVVHLTYFQTQIYFHLKPIDYSLYRCILNPREEQLHIDQLVRGQVEKFIASSRNYALARRISNLQFKPSKIVYENVQQLSSTLLARYDSPSMEHRGTVTQLRALMAEGHLQPTTRSPEEVRRLARAFTGLVLCIVLVALSFVILVGLILPVSGYFTTFKTELDPLDVIFAVELWLSCFIGIHAIALYLGIVVISCVDQIRLANSVSKMIRDCISLNEMDYYRHKCAKKSNHVVDHTSRSSTLYKQRNVPSPSNSEPSQVKLDPTTRLDEHSGAREWLEDSTRLEQSFHVRMNMNLLRALIHYKIFVVQLKPLHGSSRFLVMVTLALMVLAPLLGRIYVVYLPIENRILLALSSVLFASVADVYFTTLCYFHGQCLKLYTAMFSLVAHVVRLGAADDNDDDDDEDDDGQHEKSAPKDSSSRQHFDPHLIWLIRKELNHPDRLIHQFATTAFGFSVTYPNYVRVHFWLGLLIISIFTVDSKERVAGLLGDSFSIL